MNSRLKPITRTIVLKTLILKDYKNSRNNNALIEHPLQSESKNALIETIDYYV